jgi:uncharacterized SAM-binding protein YcdF (DUF218 family)
VPFKQNLVKRCSLATLLCSVGAACLFMWRDLPAKLLVLSDPPELTDAAMVFGGDPYYERTKHASRLFRNGMTRVLLVCGGETSPGDSAESLRQKALEHGVPARKILLENRSRSTRESVLYSKSILQKHRIRSLTLVTSPFHQRRAYWVARKALGDKVKLVNSPADPSHWTPKGWWKSWSSIRFVLKEYGKLAYYFVRGWI